MEWELKRARMLLTWDLIVDGTDGQPSGDLRIVQPLDHQGQHFTLALRQVKTGRRRLIGCLNQGLRSLRRERGAAGVRSADGPHQVRRRRHP